MNDACYCSSDGKIYGVSGPYVIQCNSTTGRREAYVRVASPLMGDMRICYHAATNSIYVAGIWQPNKQYLVFPGVPHDPECEARNVFPVSTSLVVGARIDLDAYYENFAPFGGFQWIGSNGNYLYVVTPSAGYSGTPSQYTLLRFDPTNPADQNSQYSGSVRFRPEHCAFSPTEIGMPNPASLANNSQLYFAPINYNLNSDWDNMYVLPHNPCAIEYCAASSKFYAVCGDTNLLRVDTITPFPGTFTALNLGAVEATADPYRIRYWSGTGRLYLPCPTANGVIVWNPNTETGEFKSGFDNPIDVVFTNAKAFAVQNARIGLREIN